MRIATLAGILCVLSAAAANAQPALAPDTAAPPIAAALPETAPPAATLQPAPLPATAAQVDPRLAANLDSITATAPTNPWAMNGSRAWVNAEYLLWWVRPMASPDLIQTVPTATALNAFATNSPLPAGSAQRFFPNGSNVDFGAISGVRLNAGMNFDRFGLEVSGFYLPEKTSSASLFNNGIPYSVAESYFRAGTGTPISLLASLAGQSTGGIQSSVGSQLWGTDANVRLPFFNLFTDSTDALVGFRYLDLKEKINLNFQSNLASGGSVGFQDSIQTHNQFYGGQVGLNGKINGCDRGLGLDLTGKMALGGMQEQATLVGSNTVTAPGQLPSTQPGGLFASGANQGTFTRDKVAMIYEQNVNLTYNFNKWSQVYIGYSIIYASNVIRAGDVIDPVINDANLRFVAGAPANTVNRPVFQFHATDFWTQGITFGVRFQY